MGDKRVKTKALQILGLFQALPRLVVFDLDYTLCPFYCVVVEALKVDSLQNLCSSLEPILRRVVSEEVERALTTLAPAGPARIQGRKYSPAGLTRLSISKISRAKLGFPTSLCFSLMMTTGILIRLCISPAPRGKVLLLHFCPISRGTKATMWAVIPVEAAYTWPYVARPRAFLVLLR